MSIRDYILTGKSDLLAKRGLSFDSDIEEDEQALTSEMLQGVINYIIKNDGFDPMPLKGYAKFPNLSPKSKYKSGDKVKIINDFIMDIKRESVNFKGFEGIVNDVIFDNFSFKFDYTIAINGRTTGLINESALELIEQSKKIEYRKDLYDIADDVDGCLLPDYQPKTELIQRKIK